MIEEHGTVTAVDGDIAEIAVERRSACGSCAAKGGCGTSLLAQWLPQRRLTLRLPNAIHARPGETVVVGLDENTLQRGSLLLYAVPLAGLLAGAVGGEALMATLGHSPELGGIGGGLLGLIAGLRLVASHTRRTAMSGDRGVALLRVAHRRNGVPAPGLPVAGGGGDGLRNRV